MRAAARAELLAQLTAAPPPMDMWEVGGASNFMITAARLGQRVACLGQLGPDVYGDFFSTIMEVSCNPANPLFHGDAHPQHLARTATAGSPLWPGLDGADAADAASDSLQLIKDLVQIAGGGIARLRFEIFRGGCCTPGRGCNAALRPVT